MKKNDPKSKKKSINNYHPLFNIFSYYWYAQMRTLKNHCFDTENRSMCHVVLVVLHCVTVRIGTLNIARSSLPDMQSSSANISSHDRPFSISFRIRGGNSPKDELLKTGRIWRQACAAASCICLLCPQWRSARLQSYLHGGKRDAQRYSESTFAQVAFSEV